MYWVSCLALASARPGANVIIVVIGDRLRGRHDARNACAEPELQSLSGDLTEWHYLHRRHHLVFEPGPQIGGECIVAADAETARSEREGRRQRHGGRGARRFAAADVEQAEIACQL